MELIKIRQQVRQPTSCTTSSTGALEDAMQITKQDGLRGLYRGIMCRDSGYPAYLAVYEATIRYWSRSSQTQNGAAPQKQALPVTLSAGGLAGIAGWITFPFDAVKQALCSASRYPNTLFTLVLLYHAKGLPVLFRGLGPDIDQVSLFLN